MKFKKKPTKIGNSYGIIIPKEHIDSGYINPQKKYEWSYEDDETTNTHQN